MSLASVFILHPQCHLICCFADQNQANRGKTVFSVMCDCYVHCHNSKVFHAVKAGLKLAL